MSENYIERRIITGLITSTEFLQQLEDIWQSKYLQSRTAKTLSIWCWEYYKKYNKAPGKDIQSIYWRKLQEGLDKEQAEWIEDVLEDLSEDYDPSQYNIEYLYDETEKYFRQQAIIELSSTIVSQAEQGEILDAEVAIATFNAPEKLTGSSICLLDAGPEKYKAAFESVGTPLISFPGDLGRFINNQLIQNAFVGFVGADKVGKTSFIFELAVRAVQQGSDVALFEVGDMTEDDIFYRHGIYLTKRSDIPEYCEDLYYPVLDCVHNQLGHCKKAGNTHALFTKDEYKEIRNKPFTEYEELLEEEKEYKHCHWCSTHPFERTSLGFKGALWYKKRGPVSPLIWQEAFRAKERFRKRHKRNIELFVYSSGELRPKDICAELDILNKKKGKVPKVVLIDYPDVMGTDVTGLDKREATNRIWQAGRYISQEYKCLVVYCTQTDTSGYAQKILNRSNFSEDKRKNAHVTAMIGMNQTDEERMKGILRLNKILVRRGHFDSRQCVSVLQCLKIGRPFLGSFF